MEGWSREWPRPEVVELWWFWGRRYQNEEELGLHFCKVGRSANGWLYSSEGIFMNPPPRGGAVGVWHRVVLPGISLSLVQEVREEVRWGDLREALRRHFPRIGLMLKVIQDAGVEVSWDGPVVSLLHQASEGLPEAGAQRAKHKEQYVEELLKLVQEGAKK